MALNIDSATGSAVDLLWNVSLGGGFEDVVVTNFVTERTSTAPMQSRSCTGLHGQLCIQEITAASGRGTHAHFVCSQDSARITPRSSINITSATHTHTHTSTRTPVNASSVTSHGCKAWFHDYQGLCRVSPIFSQNITNTAVRESHTTCITHTQLNHAVAAAAPRVCCRTSRWLTTAALCAHKTPCTTIPSASDPYLQGSARHAQLKHKPCLSQQRSCDWRVHETQK